MFPGAPLFFLLQAQPPVQFGSQQPVQRVSPLPGHAPRLAADDVALPSERPGFDHPAQNGQHPPAGQRQGEPEIHPRRKGSRQHGGKAPLAQLQQHAVHFRSGNLPRLFILPSVNRGKGAHGKFHRAHQGKADGAGPVAEIDQLMGQHEVFAPGVAPQHLEGKTVLHVLTPQIKQFRFRLMGPDEVAPAFGDLHHKTLSPAGHHLPIEMARLGPRGLGGKPEMIARHQLTGGDHDSPQIVGVIPQLPAQAFGNREIPAGQPVFVNAFLEAHRIAEKPVKRTQLPASSQQPQMLQFRFFQPPGLQPPLDLAALFGPFRPPVGQIVQQHAD